MNQYICTSVKQPPLYNSQKCLPCLSVGFWDLRNGTLKRHTSFTSVHGELCLASCANHFLSCHNVWFSLRGKPLEFFLHQMHGLFRHSILWFISSLNIINTMHIQSALWDISCMPRPENALLRVKGNNLFTYIKPTMCKYRKHFHAYCWLDVYRCICSRACACTSARKYKVSSSRKSFVEGEGE